MLIKKEHILVVDDDQQMRQALTEAIRRLDYEVTVSASGKDALAKLRNHDFSLVITDMKMPTMSGLELLREIKQLSPKLPVLVITAFGTIENAVETMKEGAVDYLLKPFSFEKLQKAIDSIIKKDKSLKSIITINSEMQKILKLAESLAATDITVVIYGESGTGKELLARYIHSLSKRSQMQFIAVNCAAIPENLLEAELFGYERGAFTGALDKKLGKFELANNGTLLLDEIAEMPLSLQAKLLRVLQEKEIDRIGGKKPIPIDVRVIVTTNKELQKQCAEGRFREDLFYRLNVFPIKLLPLRERKEDIPLLAEHFLKVFSASFSKKIRGFSTEALEFLKNQPWYGNVRELENLIQRAVFICEGEEVRVDDFLFEENTFNKRVNGKLKDMERELIIRTLKEVKGNKTKAAKLLGVSVRTIRNKLNEYRRENPALA
ncbi:MAG: sigma-54 dependent transcriptional regulator [Thermodesulfovibrionales bacterium]|nr:sigma-54 dependent transcriptional regulator [Thermodesulfovibrionales bacterium]